MERDEEFIKNVALGCNVEESEVRSEWDAVASDVFISTALASGQMSEAQAKDYIMAATQSRFTSLDAAEPQNLVALGFSSARKPRGGGDMYSEIFALFPDLDATPKIRRINVNGDVYVYKNITWSPPTYFEGVRLIAYQDGGFKADRRANFDDGSLTDESDDYLAFVPTIKIADIPRNLARQRPGTGKQSWEDSTDWRAVIGIVVLGSAKGGERADGSGEWGMFEVNDNSMMSPVNIDAKTVLTPALTCWCPRELVPVSESIVKAYGPLSKVKPAQDGSRPGGFQMNVKRVDYLVKRDVEE
jgi:hypothetical protein